jgi:hypothetical protein
LGTTAIAAADFSWVKGGRGIGPGGEDQDDSDQEHIKCQPESEPAKTTNSGRSHRVTVSGRMRKKPIELGAQKKAKLGFWYRVAERERRIETPIPIWFNAGKPAFH